MLHVGKRAPKGWVEVGGSIHLGRGMYLIRCVPEIRPTLTTGTTNKDDTPRARKRGGK